MQEKGGKLYLKLAVGNCIFFEKLCNENGYNMLNKENYGVLKFVKFLLHRPGLIAGTSCAVGLMIYFSNVVIKIDVLCDNKEIEKKIFDVLNAENITAGTYIPEINYVVVERELKQRIDEISWAGITRNGNNLLIDVVENEEMPKFRKQRLPSNLVSCENGVIDKIECLDGQIKLGVGCGVVKGDIIVGGEIVTNESQWIDGKENIETTIDYARCNGVIYGSFERTVTFEQPFEDRKEYETGEKDKVSYINFFSADIPLFINIPYGYYKTQTSVNNLELLGFELPISLTSCNLTEYDFTTTTYSENDAKELCRSKAFKYEQNFLADYDIKNRTISFEVTDTGVKETVSYSLYGVISKEVEFFINK